MAREMAQKNQKNASRAHMASVIATIAGLVLISISTLTLLMLNCTGVISLNDEGRCRDWSVVQTHAQEISEPVSVLFVGDMMFGRDVESVSKRRTGYTYPFARTLDILQSADITMGNLESPLTPGDSVVTESMVFRADTEWAQALADAGFDVVGLANNHLPNQGSDGIWDTLEALDAAGIAHTGAGMDRIEAESPAIRRVRDLTVAFLAYNDTDVVPDSYFSGDEHAGTALMDIEMMQTAVGAVRDLADVVIVTMHAGNEYVPLPSVRQTDFAHAAIDAGADLVIGHHPHVVQTAEVYRGKYIFYSLGNYIFDQMWSVDTRRGIALDITLDHEAVVDVRVIPVEIDDYSQPHLISDPVIARQILDRLALDYLLDESECHEYYCAGRL